jgi:hypothetical protein
MRKSKFSEEQIIAILAEQERGMATAEASRGQLGDVLQVEGQVRRAGRVRCASVEGVGD